MDKFPGDVLSSCSCFIMSTTSSCQTPVMLELGRVTVWGAWIHWVEPVIHWFIESLIHWFIDSLVRVSICSLIRWLTESPIQCVIDSLSHRLIDSSVCYHIDSVSHCWFIASSTRYIHWFSDSLMHWLLTESFMHSFMHDSLIRWFADSLMCWFIDSLIHCFVGSLVAWSIEPLLCCLMDSLMQWLAEPLIPCFIGSFSVVHGFFDVISFASQQPFKPFAHPFMHRTTSTLHCFCIAKPFL